MSMMTVYTEFVRLTCRLTALVKENLGIDYQDAAVELDDYIEQIVRLHVLRKKYGVIDSMIRQFFMEYVHDNPIITPTASAKYWALCRFELLIRDTDCIWQAIDEDMTYLPQSDFLLWHVGDGVWKMLTTGVTYND